MKTFFLSATIFFEREYWIPTKSLQTFCQNLFTGNATPLNNQFLVFPPILDSN